MTGIMFLLIGCGTDQSDDPSGEADMNDEEVTVEVETAEQDDGLRIQITVHNQMSDTVDLTFRSGHQFDLRLYDEHDEKVYDFAEGMMFTEAIIEERLDPGDSLTFEDIWTSYSEDHGSLRVEAEVLAEEFELQAETEHP